MNKQQRARTSLFLMEIIITIGLFMVCGALCIQFFVNAHLTDEKSQAISNSAIICESAINIISSSSGPLETLQKCYEAGVIADANTFVVSYDKDFNPVEDGGKYILTVNVTEDDETKGCLKISAKVTSDKEEIYSINTKKANNF